MTILNMVSSSYVYIDISLYPYIIMCFCVYVYINSGGKQFMLRLTFITYVQWYEVISRGQVEYFVLQIIEMTYL